MKIAWFTPLSKKSAIARYNKLLTDELNNKIKIDLWLSNKKDLLNTRLKKIFYKSTDDLTVKLKNYDLIVYNIGNYLEYHKDIYEVSQKHKGIIILHDFILHHFFVDYYFNYKKDINKYLLDIEKYYGKKARNKIFNKLKNNLKPVWETNEVLNYPLFEKAIENSYGVIACSKFLAKKIKYNILRPVKTIYNPFYATKKTFTQKKVNKKDFGIPSNKLILATVGHIITPKKIEKVIYILKSDKDLRSKVIFLILGEEIDKKYSSFLKSLVKKYHLEQSVKFLGYLDDNTLHGLESVVDIFINLRFPFTGGASWSVIEEMHFGKPIIVSDTGFFRELPNDSVIKINSRNKDNEIRFILKKLVSNAILRDKIGIKGKEFAIQKFRVDIYCREFEDYVKKIIFLKPFVDLFY